jgi:ribosomal-protein-alanine N-acetyltransferase
VIVRAAVAADATAVAALEQATFGVDAWSPASVVSELTGDGRRAVVAVDGDELVGYAITLGSGDLMDLQRIAVTSGWRRRGVARALLADVLTSAGEAGAARMLLEVSADNAGAIGFYRRAGFVEIDRRRRYYRDGTDAVVMALDLGGSATRPAPEGE